jgi:hypothetical protein
VRRNGPQSRGPPTAILWRESYREGKRTLLNLSVWPAERDDGLCVLLKGGVAIPPDQEAFKVERSLPHGAAANAHGMALAT